MINYQTILSNYNKRGTLLKWLRTLQTALEEGALETVTTTTTEDTVVFHFGFADGTSLDSPPIQLEAGPPGTAATIEIGNVSTLPSGSDATVVNTGTTSAAVLDFGIPQGIAGQDGDDGAAATVAVGSVTTLPAGSSATVTNSGTPSAAVLDFGIPQGANGDPGEVIEQIVPVEATTTASRAYATGDYFVNNLGVLVQATANIALGGTIDSTNSTPVNETLADELVSVNSSLAQFLNGKVWSDFTQPTLTNGTHYRTGCRYVKIGCFLFLLISVQFDAAPTSTLLFNLPSGYIPVGTQQISVSGGGSYNAKAQCEIKSTGEVRVTSVDKWVIGSGILLLSTD